MKKVNILVDAISQPIQTGLQSLWDNWVNSHWAISFLVNHPIITVILLVMAILTIWGFIQMLPKLFVNFWLMLFKSPFILGKSLLKISPQSSETETLKLSTNLLTPVNRDHDMQEILTKLNNIETQQKLILKHLKQLAKND